MIRIHFLNLVPWEGFRMNSTELLQVLIKTNPFEILDSDILETLSAKMTVKAFEPNTYVFKQEDPSRDALFIIASGLVELTVTDDRGMETVVGLKRAYDFFGETVVLSRERYPASARVKKKLTCGLIYRKLGQIHGFMTGSQGRNVLHCPIYFIGNAL